MLARCRSSRWGVEDLVAGGDGVVVVDVRAANLDGRDAVCLKVLESTLPFVEFDRWSVTPSSLLPSKVKSRLRWNTTRGRSRGARCP